MFTLKTTEYELYPAGQDTGKIIDVLYVKDVETIHGVKDKIDLVIESDTHSRKDGQQFLIELRYNAVASLKGKLYEARVLFKGRDLTPEELTQLDPGEFLGRRVGIQVAHKAGREGGMFANVVNLWPIDDSAQPAAAASDESTADASLPF
jgi:hypothetical protein